MSENWNLEGKSPDVLSLAAVCSIRWQEAAQASRCFSLCLMHIYSLVMALCLPCFVSPILRSGKLLTAARAALTSGIASCTTTSTDWETCLIQDCCIVHLSYLKSLQRNNETAWHVKLVQETSSKPKPHERSSHESREGRAEPSRAELNLTWLMKHIHWAQADSFMTNVTHSCVYHTVLPCIRFPEAVLPPCGWSMI